MRTTDGQSSHPASPIGSLTSLSSISSSPSRGRPAPRPALITFDLLLRVLQNSILHPFIAWLLPLCLRAQATPYSHPSFIITTAYAGTLTVVLLLLAVNKWIAYGAPREVNLAEEVVLVIGGASGIGKLIAETYGMKGVSVAVVDIKPGPSMGEEEEDEMSNIRHYQCDVGDRSKLEEVARRIESDLGIPTILVHCAATRIHGLPLLSLSESAVRKTIDSNLLSYFHTLQVFLPGLLTSPTGGTIVTLSSVLANLTAAGLADYSATKAAMSAVHCTLEAELRQSGAQDKVKTLRVETGQVATQLFESVETPNRFMAPVLEPVQVMREIVSIIDTGNGGVLRLPAYASLVSWYAVLPASIQRLVRYIVGIDTAVWKATFSTEPEKSKKGWTTISEMHSDSDVESIDSEE